MPMSVERECAAIVAGSEPSGGAMGGVFPFLHSHGDMPRGKEVKPAQWIRADGIVSYQVAY